MFRLSHLILSITPLLNCLIVSCLILFYFILGVILQLVSMTEFYHNYLQVRRKGEERSLFLIHPPSLVFAVPSSLYYFHQKKLCPHFCFFILFLELDGVQSLGEYGQGKRVVVVAATNRPDMLDPALIRPGRIDRKVGEREGEISHFNSYF